VFAFAFFGWVRVLEAVLKAFATNPPKLRKLTQCSNAMDPLTVAWLAYNLRKPILGILQVDPTDFQKLATLKGKLWEELHAFFERQWKVVSFSSDVVNCSDICYIFWQFWQFCSDILLRFPMAMNPKECDSSPPHIPYPYS
jgi:hypothetical protein